MHVNSRISVDWLIKFGVLVKIAGRIPDFECLVATNGPNGVALAKSSDPDLIQMDIDLPGPKGFDVMKALKDDKRTREIPVVALSADANPATLERAKLAGFTDLLTKPLSPDKLFQTLVNAQGPN